MKQNERLLVYAVTGFLVLILLIAVVFGSEPKSDGGRPGGAKGIDELLDGVSPVATGSQSPAQPTESGRDDAGFAVRHSGSQDIPGSAGGPAATGLADASLLRTEQPLVARPQAAADVVAQRLGASRRDHTVRFVRARAGDSLSTLVQRWCGAVDPFLEEARALNEELRVVQVGQEVAVPWIDDEQLIAQLDLKAVVPVNPRTLIGDPAATPGAAPAMGAAPGDRLASLLAGAGSQPPAAGAPGASPRPDFQLPIGMSAGSPSNAGVPAAGATTSYTVKSGDSLWAIAARRYGRKNADRMVKEILALNTGASETLKVGQVLVLPPTE